MAKQRRNRERATELMSILDELVPAVYPYRAFTSSNSEESSLRKRSRNKTLEDVIASVNKVLAQAERESRRLLNTNVDMEDLFASEYAGVGVAVLQDNGEVISASPSLCRILNKPMSSLVGSRIFIATGGWTQNKDGSVTCETSPQNVILGQIKNRDNMTMQEAAANSRSKTLRTLMVHEYIHSCAQYGPLAEQEKKQRKRQKSRRAIEVDVDDNYPYSETGSTMGSIQMRSVGASIGSSMQQSQLMSSSDQMHSYNAYAPNNTPMQSVNMVQDSSKMSFRNLFSSMLDSRELQGLDMLSRQLAMAKAEQAFIDELNSIEKRKMMAELEGPKSMTTAEFNMHKQRLDHMRQQQHQQHQHHHPSVHQQLQQLPRQGSMPDGMGGGFTRSGSCNNGGGYENTMGPPGMQVQHHNDMPDDQAYQFRSVQITRDQMMSAMGTARANSWDGRRDNDCPSSWGRHDEERTRLDVNSPKNGMGWGDGGGGMPYGGSGGGGGGGMSALRYGDAIGEQAGGSSHYGMCSPGGGEMAKGYSHDGCVGGFGGMQAGSSSSMDNLDNMQNDWSNEQAAQMRAVRVNIGQILRNQQREAGHEGAAAMPGGGQYSAGSAGQNQGGQGAVVQQGAQQCVNGGAAAGVPANQNDDFQLGGDQAPQMMFQV